MADSETGFFDWVRRGLSAQRAVDRVMGAFPAGDPAAAQRRVNDVIYAELTGTPRPAAGSGHPAGHLPSARTAAPAAATAAAGAPAEPHWRDLLPPGICGYLVGCWRGSRFTGTTHTTPMSLEEARREAGAHEARDRASLAGTARVTGLSWRPVEIREAAP